jgi:transcription termination/antitermination protein NusG
VSDDPHKLAEEATDELVAGGEASNGTAFESTASGDVAEEATEHVAAEDVVGAGEDSDAVMSSVEEPIAEEAAAYEEGAQEIAADEAEAEEDADAEAVEDEEIAEETAEAEDSDKGPVYLAPPEEDDIHMDWYILKVQSNRERSIAEALERKIKVDGLERYFDQVIVPTEKVTEFKGGKKKVVERKLYPGYIVVHMHINDDTWFAVRETSGVGDFTGAGGKPTPMLPHEVSKIVQTEAEETTEAPKLDIKFAAGDKVKVKEGNFESFEGEVGSIDEASGRVTVMINIFGRSTPVELEYWQIEAM